MAKNKKVIGLMKDELSEDIMKEFMALRPKMHSYLMMMFMLIKGQKALRNV